MSAFAKDIKRRLVPRWRFVKNTNSSSEFASTPRKMYLQVLDKQFLQQKLIEWEQTPNYGNAIDLIICGVGGGWLDEVKPATRYLEQYRNEFSTQTDSLVQYVLQKTETVFNLNSCPRSTFEREQSILKIVQSEIATTRRILRFDYRNPLAWLDMALGYTILGQRKQAQTSIDHALYLAPEHRQVLRSAIRYYIHIGDIERAHALLKKNPRTKFDPWLVATELAVARVAGQSPTFVRVGRKLVESGLPPEHLTELHSAIGTLEFQDGALRQARRSFRASLVEPTDNTVAQARWMRRHLREIDINEEAFNLPLNFEARCWRDFENGQWENAQKECLNWLDDELFSSRPATLGSYIGLTLTAEFELARKCAEIGIKADSNDITLRNNLTVALSYCGEIENAIDTFAKISIQNLGNLPKYAYIATLGLLHFRIGDIKSGRKCYDQAKEIAPNSAKSRLDFFWVREEINANTTNSSVYLEKFLLRDCDPKDNQMPRLKEQLQNQLKKPISKLSMNNKTEEDLLKYKQQLMNLKESVQQVV